MNNFFEKTTRIIIIILLIFLAYCLFEISKNGRYQLEISSERPILIIDTKTGITYVPIRGENPKPYSYEVK